MQHLSPDSCRRQMQHSHITAVSRFKLGYPSLAAFHSSDEDFAIYRRFGYLQSRLILEKQDQLRILEERLDGFDKSDFMKHTRNLDPDSLRPWQALLQEIEAAFTSYGTVKCRVLLAS